MEYCTIIGAFWVDPESPLGQTPNAERFASFASPGSTPLSRPHGEPSSRAAARFCAHFSRPRAIFHALAAQPRDFTRSFRAPARFYTHFPRACAKIIGTDARPRDRCGGRGFVDRAEALNAQPIRPRLVSPEREAMP